MAPKAEKNAHIYTLQEPPGVPFDDLCNGVSMKSKRVRTGKDTEVPKNCGLSIPATSTLMEAQEFGEMMEHVDEVNFALDRLRKGQPVTNRRDRYYFLQGVQRIKEWGSESEKNRRCIVDNGTPSVLASGFRKFVSDSINENMCVLEEMLNALIWMLPLQFDAQKIFDLQNPCFAWFGSRRIKIPPANVKLLQGPQARPRRCVGLPRIQLPTFTLLFLLLFTFFLQKSPTKNDFSFKEAIQNEFWVFVNMASGRYLWRNLRAMNRDTEQKSS